MPKLSIEITGKIRSALFVLAALWEQGPTVAGLVTDKLRASLTGGEEPPDFLAQIRGLGQILKFALDLMVELDKLLVAEDQQRFALYRDREEKIADLGRKITGVRRIITGHFVNPDLKSLGLEGRTERESIALQRQTELICERVASDDLDDLLGDSLFEPRLDPRPFEPQIQPGVVVLREAFEAHQRSRRRVDELRARKNEAVESYDDTFIRVARQFEDLCRLAGLDALADRLRPSLTRRGETAEPPAGEEPAGDASASEPVAEPVAESDSEAGDEPAAEPASSA